MTGILIRGDYNTDTQREGHVKIQEEEGHLLVKERGLRRNHTCRPLDLGHVPSRNPGKLIPLI